MGENTLGDRIAEARQMTGLTQAEWVERLTGSTRSPTGSEWEKNKSVPDLGTLRKMLDLSGMDGHYLMTGEPPKVRTEEESTAHARAEAYDRIASIVLRLERKVDGGLAGVSGDELDNLTGDGETPD